MSYFERVTGCLVDDNLSLSFPALVRTGHRMTGEGVCGDQESASPTICHAANA